MSPSKCNVVSGLGYSKQDIVIAALSGNVEFFRVDFVGTCYYVLGLDVNSVICQIEITFRPGILCRHDSLSANKRLATTIVEVNDI